MKRFKWILATTALTIGLSGAMFAQEQGRNGVRDEDNQAVYTQRQTGDREGAWNNGYGGDNNYRADRDRDYRDRSDRDGAYRDGDYRDGDLDRDAYRTQNREHRDRDHRRRDRDDRDRDRR